MPDPALNNDFSARTANKIYKILALVGLFLLLFFIAFIYYQQNRNKYFEKSYKKERISVEFDYAIIDPIDIAKTIDLFYNKNIEKFSLLGKEYNLKNSWKQLKETYLELLSA